MADMRTTPGDQQARTGSQPEAKKGHRATTAPPTHTPGAARGITVDGVVSAAADGEEGA